MKVTIKCNKKKDLFTCVQSVLDKISTDGPIEADGVIQEENNGYQSLLGIYSIKVIN